MYSHDCTVYTCIFFFPTIMICHFFLYEKFSCIYFYNVSDSIVLMTIRFWNIITIQKMAQLTGINIFNMLIKLYYFKIHIKIFLIIFFFNNSIDLENDSRESFFINEHIIDSNFSYRLKIFIDIHLKGFCSVNTMHDSFPFFMRTLLVCNEQY